MTFGKIFGTHHIDLFCSYLISLHSLSEGKGALVSVRAPTVLLPARRAVGIAAPRRGAHPFAVLEEIKDQSSDIKNQGGVRRCNDQRSIAHLVVGVGCGGNGEKGEEQEGGD